MRRAAAGHFFHPSTIRQAGFTPYSPPVQRLTDNPADDMRPDWSPDGSQIVFQSDRDGNLEIYVMNVKDALQGADGGGAAAPDG